MELQNDVFNVNLFPSIQFQVSKIEYKTILLQS